MKSRRSDTSSDIDRVKDANQILKAENRKLRKENAQLRKELNRSINVVFDKSLELEDEIIPQFPPQKETKETQEKCPKCKNDALVKIKAGRYVIRICEECGYKKRTDSK